MCAVAWCTLSELVFEPFCAGHPLCFVAEACIPPGSAALLRRVSGQAARRKIQASKPALWQLCKADDAGNLAVFNEDNAAEGPLR